MADHILDFNSDLTDRAREFLRGNARRVDIAYAQTESEAAQDYRDVFNAPSGAFAGLLGSLRERLGGLQYYSHSWSFREVITFAPEPDLDAEDPGGMISLLEHSVAQPFGVWVAENGRVNYMYPTELGADYVEVFTSSLGLIESDAVYAQCQEWTLIGQGRLAGAVGIEESVSTYPIIIEASGSTECWREIDGIRVFIWKTYAAMLNSEDSARWGIWARDSDAAERAHTYFKQWL